MNRNVTIVVVILVLVVIAGYMIWIRSKYQAPMTPKSQEEVQIVEPSPSPSPVVSATPGTKEATGSTKPKAATSSSSGR